MRNGPETGQLKGSLTWPRDHHFEELEMLSSPARPVRMTVNFWDLPKENATLEEYTWRG